jgi:nucleoid-associated protein YgaU
MQSIERYGVIALVFLVVTVVAVLLWDGKGSKSKPKVGVGQDAKTELSGAGPGSDLARLQSSPRLPLRRDLESPSASATAEPNPDAQQVRGLDGAPIERTPSTLELQSAPSGAAGLGARPTTPAPVEAPARDLPAERLYVVRNGDTLSEIALGQLGSSKRWPEIVRLNPGLDPGRLRVGARLVMPAGAQGSVSTSATAPATAPATRSATYSVRAGDSLWRIAARSLGDGERWREIVALNPGLDPDRLTVGTRLALPSGASTSAPVVAKLASATTSKSGRVK